jgi:hypothetical protein
MAEAACPAAPRVATAASDCPAAVCPLPAHRAQGGFPDTGASGPTTTTIRALREAWKGVEPDDFTSWNGGMGPKRATRGVAQVDAPLAQAHSQRGVGRWLPPTL